MEVNIVKQIVAFLIAEKRLPASARIDLPLRKPQGTDTHCWTKDEVIAILEYTRARPKLLWLYVLLATLAYSGMRIGEAIGLRWRNVDLATGIIKVVDDSTTGRAKGGSAQTNKGGRDRSFPIHDELMPILQGIPKHADGYVFHSPRGARLKTDTIRIILVRDVLAPLAPSFPTPEEEPGFADGRLHSFRHSFCSLYAIEGTSQQVVMQWLGHRDSRVPMGDTELIDTVIVTVDCDDHPSPAKMAVFSRFLPVQKIERRGRETTCVVSQPLSRLRFAAISCFATNTWG